ncbi:citrate synthase [Rhodovarius lipocyclicus]|nr:citrate synthase [Rhodovarius lipocyclicus]
MIKTINMPEWIDRETVLTRLGVKPQTLYAYVSRGRIDMRPDPADPRRSLYRAEDVAALATRRARGRRPAAIAESLMAWGEPSVPTAISTVHHGTLYYRGRNLAALDSTAEAVAALLWQAPRPVTFAPGTPGDPFQTLAGMIPLSQPMLGRSPDRLREDAAQVVGRLAPGDGPLHQRLARGWGAEDAADRIRQALVAMADHDLNASTFATRVAASTGASLAASLLAGLCTLSGPRHGGACPALVALLGDAARDGAGAAVRAWLNRDALLPGFGHPLYPHGDQRAAIMLQGLVPDPAMAALRDQVAADTGLLPNCDFALVAVARAFGLPPEAPFTLFMLGRTMGWCAHAMEQVLKGGLIRPRGRYVGPALD